MLIRADSQNFKNIDDLVWESGDETYTNGNYKTVRHKG
jgi:hypothetical protein